jgi:hypothetical protein
MKSKKQVKPKWFEGIVYEEGTTVHNPFSGESYELNALELSIYDFIIGANQVLETVFDNGDIGEPNKKTKKLVKDLHEGLDWFRENNAKAYMILLD